MSLSGLASFVSKVFDSRMERMAGAAEDVVRSRGPTTPAQMASMYSSACCGGPSEDEWYGAMKYSDRLIEDSEGRFHMTAG